MKKNEASNDIAYDNSKVILLFFSVTIVGGAETNFVKISRDLKDRGYKLYLAVNKDNGPFKHLINDFIEDFIIVDFHKFYKLPSVLLQYYKFIKKYNIVYVLNFGLKVELFSRLFSKKFGIKYLISNIRSTDDWRNWYHTYLDRVTQYNVDVWVANSIAGRNAFLRREKIDPNRSFVIYNYVDDESVSNKIFFSIKEEIQIGVLSNIKNGKGFEDLILLSKMLNENNVFHRFVIAGQDLLNGAFQQMVSVNCLDSYFEFVGYISDKSSFFNRIDVFLLPSYLEGLPTSIIEAMQNGKPVISTDVGGIPELILDKHNGLLSNPGDIKGFYDSINTMIENPEISKSFIAHSYGILKMNFVKSKVIQQWQSILN